MLLKVVVLLLVFHIVAASNAKEYMIKNLKTGNVIEVQEGGNKLFTSPYLGRDSQKWILEPSGNPQYTIFRNIETWKVLDACPVTKKLVVWEKHGNRNQQWHLNILSDQTLHVAYYPNDYLTESHHHLKLSPIRQDDGSDMWTLVEVSQARWW